MQLSRRTVTREYVAQASRRAGLELSDTRVDELVPMLQAVLDGLESVRRMVGKSEVEPAPTFRSLEE